MKSVLISINPQWCELIASGKKTIEVRKQKPKLKTPFKVYIYCTLPPKSEFFWHLDEEGKRTIGEYARELLRLPNGEIVYDYGMRLACEKGKYTKENFLCQKVIGEFVCDKIDRLAHCGTCNNDIRLRVVDENFFYKELDYEFLNKCKLSYLDIEKYSNGCDVYGWNISNLVIYKKPRDLREFKSYNTSAYLDEKTGLPFPTHKITKPPRNWLYVYTKK